ncbi:MAG: 3-oxoacyl-[acyl-carrier-protein] synthase III C-terminal domain-containing protein [Syntrophomonadaceae bacterium]
MNLKYKNKKISGLLAVLPQNEQKFDDEVENYNFSVKQSMKLKKIMGYDRHRVVTPGTCVSDLASFGLNYLFENGLVKKDDLDALVLMTQTPDYLMPPTSNVVQGQLGLKPDMICLDIKQGCAGYLVGLMQAFSLLDQESINKVALVNADVLSRKTSTHDRNTYPLIGDGAGVTILEKDPAGPDIFANIRMDGGQCDALIIPAGGLKMPSTPETAVVQVDEEGNSRSLDDWYMDGMAVFNYVVGEVPTMISSLLEFAGRSSEEVDYFMFHQPNKFMLQRLADKMGISYDKMPNNIVEHFGNASGATIPINMVYNLADKLRSDSYEICMAGFGVGLTISSMLMKVGHLDFCQMIEY